MINEPPKVRVELKAQAREIIDEIQTEFFKKHEHKKKLFNQEEYSELIKKISLNMNLAKLMRHSSEDIKKDAIHYSSMVTCQDASNKGFIVSRYDIRTSLTRMLDNRFGARN